MSASNAAALRRRVGNQSNPPRPGGGSATSSIPTSNNTTTSAKQSGMTLQEVISHFNKKIQSLEENMSNISPSTTNTGSTASGTTPAPNSDELNVIFSEFNDRFELFAQEIALMKEQLLKLQTYTMDVNKVLYEERVRVLSNSESNNKMSSNDLDSITEDVDAQTINSSTLISDPIETSSMNMMDELKTSAADGGGN
jgi:hypothetical protein